MGENTTARHSGIQYPCAVYSSPYNIHTVYPDKKGEHIMIFYFTGTGNSLELARMVQEATDDELVSMRDATDADRHYFELAADERLGFVFPTHCWGTPEYVDRFVDSLEIGGITPKTYVYLITDCGASTGRTTSFFKKRLKARGIPLTAAFDVRMPDNYVISFKAPSEQTQEKIRADARKRMEQFVIPNITTCKPGYHNKRGIGLLLSSTNNAYKKYGRKTAPFYVKEVCTSCGLCARNCPSHAIEMVTGTPQWTKDSCSFCLACINRCPVQAIEYGAKTKDRGRYVNPLLRE
jgi:ferredoxin